MKKAQRNFLGLLGLSAVATMTMVAANIPSPGATAISSITDTLEVRVVGSTPAVGLSSLADGQVITFPNFTVSVQYENATEVTLKQKYLGGNGEEREIAKYENLDYIAGSVKDLNFTLTKGEYGKYIIIAEAIGYDGVPAPEAYVEFEYLPLEASYTINSITGAYDVSVTQFGDDVSSAEVYLGDELIGTLSLSDLMAGKTVPVSMSGRPSGTYIIKVVAKNADGKTIYIPFTITIEYQAAEVPDAGAPDTGGLFRNLNISNEDYLTTGLIMFFVLGIVALGIVFSGKKSEGGKKRR